MPLLARMPTGMPCDVREAGDQRGAVERLELVELGAVDEPRDHLAHVVLLASGRPARCRRARPRRRAGSRGGSSGMSTVLLVLRLATMRRAMRQRMARRRPRSDRRRRSCAHARRRRRDPRPTPPRRSRPSPAAGRRGRWCPALCTMMVSSRHRRHIGAARGARAHHHGDLRDAERATASPGCRRCGRNARGRETPRSGAAGWRRRESTR